MNDESPDTQTREAREESPMDVRVRLYRAALRQQEEENQEARTNSSDA